MSGNAPDTISASFLCSRTLYDAIGKRAKEHGTNRSNYIRALVIADLESAGIDASPLNDVRQFRSLRGDLTQAVIRIEEKLNIVINRPA